MAVLEWAMHNIPCIIAVCLAFGFIITIHELGHFIMARRVGIRCPKFAIGFGPHLFSFDFRGTEFSICLLPLGGYVMMMGEDPDADEGEEEFKLVSSYVEEGDLPATRGEIVAKLEAKADSIEAKEKPLFMSVLNHIRFGPDRSYDSVRELEGNFNDKTYLQRMLVVIGGVTMNFISALILFWIIGACYGLVNLSPNSLPVVMKVFDNSPAAVAGLSYGDRIEAVDGQTVVSGSEMVQALAVHPGEKVSLSVKRGSKLLNMDITPNLYVAGVSFAPDEKAGGLPKVVAVNAFGEGCGADGLAEGDVIESCEQQPLHGFADFKSLLEQKSQVPSSLADTKITVRLGLRGKTLPAMLEGYPAELSPSGKIGIMPAQVTEFQFINDTTNKVVEVAPNSAAAQAGFEPGDTIFLVNGALVMNAGSLNDLLAKLSEGTRKELVFDCARGEEHKQMCLQAGAKDCASLGLTLEPVTFGLVFQNSFKLIGRLIVAPVIIVEKMITKELSPSLVKASMSGPLGIMQLIFELSDQGLGKFLYIVALINAAVGAFNVIPFPALDGARFFILAFCAIFRLKLDYRKEAMVHQVGLYALLALVLFVTFIDVQRMWFGVPITK